MNILTHRTRVLRYLLACTAHHKIHKIDVTDAASHKNFEWTVVLLASIYNICKIRLEKVMKTQIFYMNRWTNFPSCLPQAIFPKIHSYSLERSSLTEKKIIQALFADGTLLNDIRWKYTPRVIIALLMDRLI